MSGWRPIHAPDKTSQNTPRDYTQHVKASGKLFFLLVIQNISSPHASPTPPSPLPPRQRQQRKFKTGCRESHSYLLLVSLRLRLEKVWHPLSPVLYGETMGSGGRSYYVSRSGGGGGDGDGGGGGRMKTGQGGKEGDHSGTVFSPQI